MPIYVDLAAIGLGFYGLSLIVRNLPKRDIPMNTDEEFAEEMRRQQIDAAFQTTGRLHNQRHIVRADFQKGNFR